MKKSKIALPYKICFFLLLFTCFFVWSKNQREPASIYPQKGIIFEGTIKEIKIDGDLFTIVIKGKEKLLLTYVISKKNERYKVSKYTLGSYIKGEGTIDFIETNRNFHMFSYRKYLWSKKIYRRCIVDKITSYKKNTNWFYEIKNKIIQKIDTSQNKEYYYTFLLGNTSFIEEKVKESYFKNGVGHLFAISGMHITFFSLVLLKLLKKCISTNWICYSLCICFLFFYAFLTGYSPSVMRSTLFFTLLIVKHFFHFHVSNIILYLFLTCFFLLYNPYFIYHTGFLFSFIISFFLLCFGSKFCKKKIWYDTLVISFLSFLASFPIQIHTNFEVNIMSIFINILFVPFVTYCIFPFSILSFLFPLDFIFSILILLLEKLSLFFSSFTLLINFPKMYFLEVVIYYIFLFLLLMYPLKKLIFLLPFFMYLYIKPLFYTPSLTMIDVGQGDSFLLQKSFYNILIDTGGKFSYVNEKKDFYKGKEIILYLKSRGIRKLHVLFLSHGDKDHMGDALYLVKHFPIKKVILNSGNDNKDEKKLLKYLKKEKIAYRKMSRGEEKVGSIKFYMLNKKNTENENEDSLILYTKIEKNNILFMGDAGVTSEKELLNAYKLPKMDILKIGHHGSITSSNFTFLKRVKPTYSLISVGKNNKYGHPHEEILNNLHKIKSHVYLTSKHGMVRISLKKQIAIESLMH